MFMVIVSNTQRAIQYLLALFSFWTWIPLYNIHLHTFSFARTSIMDPNRSARDLKDLKNAIDSAHKRIEDVYGEIHRESSRNLVAAAKLRASVSKTSSAVVSDSFSHLLPVSHPDQKDVIHSQATHYEKQCLLELFKLRGPVTKSVHDGNIVRQFIEQVNSSSSSLNKQLQHAITRIPDIRNTVGVNLRFLVSSMTYQSIVVCGRLATCKGCSSSPQCVIFFLAYRIFMMILS